MAQKLDCSSQVNVWFLSLLRTSGIFYVPGTTGNLKTRDDWASGERQAVTVQKQEFASASEE